MLQAVRGGRGKNSCIIFLWYNQKEIQKLANIDISSDKLSHGSLKSGFSTKLSVKEKVHPQLYSARFLNSS